MVDVFSATRLPMLRDDPGAMETVITLVAGLLVLAPFVVLALRTTRWDPVERRRRRIPAGLPRRPVGRRIADDLRRVEHGPGRRGGPRGRRPGGAAGRRSRRAAQASPG